ncbi:hypothetical protein ACFQMH_07580 [Streptomyces viridiviolaceus]|uniref:Uncharacterized protein n=1 Tax=Streptomyces viridiviolaceus TaxID=68282 RepID=A0ABW2DZ43_9ACTN|nr:hypothetical protein [Streptomyces viridiviolaceus]
MKQPREQPISAPLAVQRVGHAWLVHPADGPDRRSLLFAGGLAADPAYCLVVVDLPPESTLDALEETVAPLLLPGHRGLRLVFGRAPAQGPTAAGRRLALRLGRPVAVPDGVLRPSAAGALFIGADRGRGWVLCTPDGREEFLSRRFPRPLWDDLLPTRPEPVGAQAVAEPVNAGTWIRPVREDDAQHRHRGYLAARLHGRKDAPTVVIGTPGAPAVRAEEVAAYWRHLPAEARSTCRFVLYAPAPAPGERPFGDVLAAALDEPVHIYNGFPASDPLVGRAASHEVLLVDADGGPGRPVFAREYLHLPPDPAGRSTPLLTIDHEWPVRHLPMLRQGLYHGGSGTVLEVLPWGLWIRSAVEPPYADDVRAAPPDPHHELILCDDSAPEALPRLQHLAEDVVRRLPPESGLMVRVLTAGRPWGVSPARIDAGSAGPLPEHHREEPARALEPAVGPRDRAGSPRDTAIVASALQRNPELGRHLPPGTALAGLVAVRLQLTARGRSEEPGTGPTGTVTPPFPDPTALEGLATLPAYDGTVAVRADLTEADVRWYAEQQVIVEPGVCAASLTGNAGRTGNTDILIRSLTGRRTALLEPEEPDRVLFRPGTRFEVLAVRARRDERAVVMLRELLPAQSPGAVPAGSAVRELTEVLRVWSEDELGGVVRHVAPDPFARPPGLGGRNGTPDRSDADDRPRAVLSGRYR